MTALPFWISIAVLSIVQGAVVAVAVTPRAVRPPARLRSRSWAIVPGLSVVAFVLLVREATGSPQALTYLALVAVPILAAVALAVLTRGARGAWALAVPALFALAWADHGGLLGQSAAVALTALSCVTLGVAIAWVTPRRALVLGIVAMALVDAGLVVLDLLQKPNNALNAARPAAGLPQLQAANFGSAVMGYGDLFIAGALGGLLALHASRRLQLRGSLLVVALALAFDLLFFFVRELPATVPVAGALLILIAARPSLR
jgi:hypothetical protein